MQKSINNTFGVNGLNIQNDETVSGNEIVAGTSTTKHLNVTGNAIIGTDNTTTCVIPSSTTIGQSYNTATNINGLANIGNGVGAVNINGSSLQLIGNVTNKPNFSAGIKTAGIDGSGSIISIGAPNDNSKNSFIYGNITIGDQFSALNTTKVFMLGENYLGISKAVHISGNDVDINTQNYSGNTIIGNSIHTGAYTTINGNTTIGDTSGSNITQINGTFYVGNGQKLIAMSGSGLALQNSTGSGDTTIGRSGITSGQTNNFLSSQNKIYNPILTDGNGNVTNNGFCLNSPSYASFCNGITYSGGTYSLPQMTARQIYLNIPTLPNFGVYPITIEYTQFILMGKGTGVNGSGTQSLATYTTGATNLGTATNISRNRICQGIMTILFNRNLTDGTQTFGYYLQSGSPTNPFAQQSFTFVNAFNGSTTANYTPLNITNINGVTNKILLQLNFPNVLQTYSSNADFCVSNGGSFRMLNSISGGSSDGTITGISISPNRLSESFGGEAYFSLS